MRINRGNIGFADRTASFIAVLLVLAYLIFLLSDAHSIRQLLTNGVIGYLLGWSVYGSLSAIRPEELVKRFALMTSSIAVCLIVVEAPAFFGVVDYRTVLGSFETENPLSVPGRHPDSELLVRHDPYYRYEVPYHGNLGIGLCSPPDVSRKVVVQYDGNGFRNPTDLKSADVAVIGDSMIEGHMINHGRLATTRLAEMQGSVVVNLGHAGYGPAEELIVLKRYGLPLQPKTVIWAFYEGNDPSDATRYEGNIADGGPSILQDLWARSLTRNAIARILHPERSCSANPEIQQGQATFDIPESWAGPVLFAPEEPVVFSSQDLRKAFSYIIEAARLCRERNIRFIVSFVPDKFRVYHDLPNVKMNTDAIAFSQVSSLPEEMGRRLALLNVDVEYLDLTHALKRASRNGIATYLPDDTHWSEQGHQIVAEALHHFLAGL